MSERRVALHFESDGSISSTRVFVSGEDGNKYFIDGVQGFKYKAKADKEDTDVILRVYGRAVVFRSMPGLQVTEPPV